MQWIVHLMLLALLLPGACAKEHDGTGPRLRSDSVRASE